MKRLSSPPGGLNSMSLYLPVSVFCMRYHRSPCFGTTEAWSIWRQLTLRVAPRQLPVLRLRRQRHAFASRGALSTQESPETPQAPSTPRWSSMRPQGSQVSAKDWAAINHMKQPHVLEDFNGPRCCTSWLWGPLGLQATSTMQVTFGV